MNFIRDNKKFITHEASEIREEITDTAAFSDTLKLLSWRSRIKSALQRLPEKCREVFELNRF